MGRGLGFFNNEKMISHYLEQTLICLTVVNNILVYAVLSTGYIIPKPSNTYITEQAYHHLFSISNI